jgi:hypothetical protein
MLSHSTIGFVAVAIGFAGYAPYLRDLFVGKTKPHLFSWIVWAILEYTGCAIQLQNGAGAGAWVTFFSAFVATVVVAYAFRYKDTNITKSDFLFFGGALAALALWFFFHQPILSAILLSITDFFAFIPTYRKSWNHPHDETLFEYAMAALKFAVAFCAFTLFTPAAIIYPTYLILANTVFVFFVLWRRAKIAK